MDFQEQDGRDGSSVRAVLYEFPWKYREFVRFMLWCEWWSVCSGLVRPAPSGAGRMITSKPSLHSGFDCIIRPAPSGAGRIIPSQPGHYPLNMKHTNYVIMYRLSGHRYLLVLITTTIWCDILGQSKYRWQRNSSKLHLIMFIGLWWYSKSTTHTFSIRTQWLTIIYI